MALVTITLEDIDVNGTPSVNFKLKLEHIGEDEGATKAMLTAHEFRHLFSSNKIDLNKTMARILGEAQITAAVKAAQDNG